MIIHAFTDGASRGNPGHAGIGIILHNERGEVILREKDYIGAATNNIAEYTALLRCIQKVNELRLKKKAVECKSLVVHSDSELVVRQMRGEYKIKDRALKTFAEKIHRLLRESPFEFSIIHIPREKNREADRLANEGIDSGV